MDGTRSAHSVSVLTPDIPALVVLAASAGGISAVSSILKALPTSFPGAIVVVQHRMPSRDSMLTEVLRRTSKLPVKDAVEGEPLAPGMVYVAHPDEHLTVTGQGTFLYVDGRRIRHVRSSANPLFTSGAGAFGPRTIAVVLTGHGSDATDGVQAVRDCGGWVIAQEPTEAEAAGMPRAAIGTGAVDEVLPLDRIPPALIERTSRLQAAAGSAAG